VSERYPKDEVRKGHHCAWQIHYHIVFPVKYRKSLLDEEITEIIKETSIGIEERYEIEMEAIGSDKNHIHLLCSAHPKLAPGKIVQIFKSITAREIFRRKPIIRKELWGGEFWTAGYYVATVGERANWNTVEAYVKKQGTSAGDLKQLRLF
jgi:putative transposase